MAESHEPGLTALHPADEVRYTVQVADAAQHAQHRLVGAAMQGAVEGRCRGGDADVGVSLAGADTAHVAG